MKKIKFLPLILILPLFLSYFIVYDTHAEIMACAEYNLQIDEEKANAYSEETGEIVTNIGAVWGTLPLCAHNLTTDSKFQEDSAITVEEIDQTWGNGPQQFASFDANGRTVIVNGIMGEPGEWGQCTAEVGTTYSEFQDCIVKILKDNLPAEYYYIDSVNGGDPHSAQDSYEGQQQEAQEQIQEIHEANTSTCESSGAAGALGWIVCPILEWMGSTSQWLYSEFLEPSLRIEPGLFNQSEGAYIAWGTFRDIANIIFVVILLAVIFSQLTGFGIDNYGIKKILPKLIVVAVLVNLSFIICEICVDVSNILGNGFQDLFDAIPTSEASLVIDGGSGESMSGSSQQLTISANDPANNQTATVNPTSGDSSGVAPTLISVAIFGVLAGAAFLAIIANPAILLSLLVSALGVIIAIFFLFILLAARQAGVIILTVISPVAFICYALPNTKSLFDKWFKLGEGLLLVYPIAGLLVGGGNFVSRLLLSSGFAANGFVTALIAMIIGIIPIFFIPTVLKSAFAALGNIGARISGLGAQMRGVATGRIRNSDAYKGLQQAGKERENRYKAGLDKNGNLTALGRVRAKAANTKVGQALGFRNRKAASIAGARKGMAANKEASVALTNTLAQYEIDTNYGGNAGAYYAAKIQEAGEKGDLNAVEAAYQAAVDSKYFRPGQLAKMARDNVANGNIRFEDSAQRASFFRNFAATNGDILKKDGEMRNWMQAGAGGNLGNYGDYWARTGVKPGDLKLEDLEALGDESFAALVNNGGLDAGTAEQLRNSRNISSAVRIMAGAYADGALSANAGSAQDLAQEAQRLAQDPNATTQFIHADPGMVNAWLKPKPQDVNVISSTPTSGTTTGGTTPSGNTRGTGNIVIGNENDVRAEIEQRRRH